MAGGRETTRSRVTRQKNNSRWIKTRAIKAGKQPPDKQHLLNLLMIRVGTYKVNSKLLHSTTGLDDRWNKGAALIWTLLASTIWNRSSAVDPDSMKNAESSFLPKSHPEWVLDSNPLPPLTR